MRTLWSTAFSPSKICHAKSMSVPRVGPSIPSTPPCANLASSFHTSLGTLSTRSLETMMRELSIVTIRSGQLFSNERA